MKVHVLATAFLAAFGWADAAHPADICEAIALRTVESVGGGGALHKGELDQAVTQFNVDKRTGRTSICSHGGSCYPTHVQVGGHLIEALRLTNCRVVYSKPSDFGDEISYGVEPIRSKNSAAKLRYDNVDNKFLEMGLCSACASNVAAFYLNKPNSQCGKLARSALEGSQSAVRKLQEDPPYCTYYHAR